MNDSPHDRSYWAVPGRLLGGCYPGDLDPQKADAKMRGILEAGVRTIISLMEPNETDHRGRPFRDYRPRMREWAVDAGGSVGFLNFPIRDTTAPSRDLMTKILDALEATLAEAAPVYIHCWGGRGRTGTVVGCHLIRHGLVAPANVLQELVRLTAHNPMGLQPTPDTDEQRAFLLAWRPGQ